MGQAQGVSAYSMAARREQISLLPRARYPLHFPGYCDTGFACACTVMGGGNVGEKDTSAISHPREMHPVPVDGYRYLFPGSSLRNGDSAVSTQSISFGDSGSWRRGCALLTWFYADAGDTVQLFARFPFFVFAIERDGFDFK